MRKIRISILLLCLLIVFSIQSGHMANGERPRESEILPHIDGIMDDVWRNAENISLGMYNILTLNNKDLLFMGLQGSPNSTIEIMVPIKDLGDLESYDYLIRILPGIQCSNEIIVHGSQIEKENVLWGSKNGFYEAVFPIDFLGNYTYFRLRISVNGTTKYEGLRYITIENRTIETNYFIQAPTIERIDLYNEIPESITIRWTPIIGARNYLLIKTNRTIDIDDSLWENETIANVTGTNITLAGMDYIGDYDAGLKLYVIAQGEYTHSKTSNPLIIRYYFENNTNTGPNNSTNSTTGPNDMQYLEVNAYPILWITGPFTIMAIIKGKKLRRFKER